MLLSSLSSVFSEQSFPSGQEQSLNPAYPFSAETVLSILNKSLNGERIVNKPLVLRQMKKLNGSASSFREWKEGAQRTLNLYLSLVSYLEPVQQEQLERLKEEFATRSLYEIRSKYLIQLNMKTNEESHDALYISLLRELMGSQGERFIKEEMAVLKQDVIQNQFEWAPVRRDEMLRLLIAAKKAKWASKDLSFNGYVVDYKDLPVFLNLAKSLLSQRLSQSQEQEVRLLLFVCNNVHYTALDCQFKPGTKTCIILDASQDPKHLLLAEELEKAGFEVAIAGENEEDKMQVDTRSCSLFSFSQAAQTAKEKNAFEQITSHPLFESSTRRIPWMALFPGLIKDCQDLSFLERYLALYKTFAHMPYKNKGKTFSAYIRDRLDPDRLPATERNRGIELKLEKYKKIIMEKLCVSSIEEISCIARSHPFSAILEDLSASDSSIVQD